MRTNDLINAMTALGHLPTKKATKAFITDLFTLINTNTAKGETTYITGFGKFEKFTSQNGKKYPKFRPSISFKRNVF